MGVNNTKKEPLEVLILRNYEFLDSYLNPYERDEQFKVLQQVKRYSNSNFIFKKMEKNIAH